MVDETYDRLWSETWGDQQTLGPVHRRQREAFLKLIGGLDVKSMIDVGCGAGDNLAAIARAFPHLQMSGVDISSEAIALAAKRLPGINLQALDIQKHRLDKTFDLVFSNQVIEHLIDDISALRNMASMSNKWVVVATMRGRMRRSELHIGHFRNYSDVELRAKAEVAGLEVVDIFGWGFPFYSPLYRTAIELLPGGPPEGHFGTLQRSVASFLYYLYGFNLPRKGDVVTMLAQTNTSINHQ